MTKPSYSPYSNILFILFDSSNQLTYWIGHVSSSVKGSQEVIVESKGFLPRSFIILTHT